MLARAGEGDRAIKTKMVRVFLSCFFNIAFGSHHCIPPLAKTSIRWQTQRWKDTKKMMLVLYFFFNLVTKKALDAYFP